MLDAKVVITTNFDKIYEGYCHSFAGSAAAYKTISYRQDDLADELPSETRRLRVSESKGLQRQLANFFSPWRGVTSNRK
jgi:hypothetical protein